MEEEGPFFFCGPRVFQGQHVRWGERTCALKLHSTTSPPALPLSPSFGLPKGVGTHPYNLSVSSDPPKRRRLNCDLGKIH